MEKQGRVGNRVTVHISDLSISFLFSLSLSLSNLFIIGKHHNIYLPGGIRCYQFSSVTQLCPTLSNPMDCSMPGFPVLYYFPQLLNYQGYVLVPMAGEEGKEVKSLCMGLTTRIDHGI